MLEEIQTARLSGAREGKSLQQFNWKITKRLFTSSD